MSLILALAVAALLAAATGVATGPVLRRLPVPAMTLGNAPVPYDPEAAAAGQDEAPDEEQPPDYAALATHRFALACAALSLVAAFLAAALAPSPWLPLWSVWATAFAMLVMVDAATTWLPLRLTRMTWVTATVAVAIAAAIALAGGPVSLADLGRVALGAAASGAFYLLLWRVGHGLGFGDVRISPLIGALGATLSWSGWWIALVAGPLLGAVWGLVRAATGRRDAFAYGPWMWLGPAVALVVHAAGPIVPWVVVP